MIEVALFPSQNVGLRPQSEEVIESHHYSRF